ncbi:hypothetical protein [Spirosoma spitsbergense]|nr:hypothetical protein [Spirosoma spitsbergense]
MRKLLLSLLLFPLLIRAQGVTQLPDRNLYRTNAYSFDLTLTQSDSAN